MPMNVHFCGSEQLGFPQPSRPIFANDITSESTIIPEQLLQHPYFDGFRNAAEQSSAPPQEAEKLVADDNVSEILGEFMEELDDKGRELFQKLVSKLVEKEIPLERFVNETSQDFSGRPILNLFEKLHLKLHDMGGGINDTKCMQRGVNHVDLMSTAEELKHKLERFKVKTINLGIVKEEKKP